MLFIAATIGKCGFKFLFLKTVMSKNTKSFALKYDLCHS